MNIQGISHPLEGLILSPNPIDQLTENRFNNK